MFTVYILYLNDYMFEVIFGYEVDGADSYNTFATIPTDFSINKTNSTH
jgi:hypothetical protein